MHIAQLQLKVKVHRLPNRRMALTGRRLDSSLVPDRALGFIHNRLIKKIKFKSWGCNPKSGAMFGIGKSPTMTSPLAFPSEKKPPAN